MNTFKLLLMALITLSTSAMAQQHKSCCQAPSATASFASLAGSNGFSGAHESPAAISYAAKGSMITFTTPDGKTGSAYFIAAEGKSNKYIFVFQEWWGLNDYIKRQADLYADSLKGVNIMAIDLYDGKVTTNPEEAGKFMQAADDARIRSIITGAYSHIGKEAKVATVGWCFGGGWSMQAALIGGKQTKGCVMYYGMPEKEESKLKALNAPVLGIFATQDGWINKPVVDAFETQMKQLNKAITIHWYDAEHAFANPSNPKFNKDAASDAMTKSIAFIKSNFLQR